MTLQEKQLAAELLELASDEFGNHNCNDWEFPSNWNKTERIKFVREYHDWNGDPEEFDKSHLNMPDFAVMSFLAWKLGMEAKYDIL